MGYLLLALAGLLGVAAVAAFGLGFHRLLARPGPPAFAHWEDMGPSPGGEHRYTPQGLTWAEGRLLFANTERNQRSRVYEIDPADMRVLRSFDMPREARHTSGLAWEKGRLWAVDHHTNRAYAIDAAASLACGSARVLGSFSTGLRKTSACALVLWEDRRLLAISDFRGSRRTIFVDREAALMAGSATGAVVFDYANEGFSQGLEFCNGHLYESENKIGVDVINRIDLEALRRTRRSRDATDARYNAPSHGVEDLAFDGQKLWTSDESVFRLFRGTLEPPEGNAEER